MEKKIAVIEVASPPDKEKFSEATNLLKTVPFLEFFFFVDFLSNDWERRAVKFSEVFLSGEFDYLWAVRGGFGSMKLIPFLERYVPEMRKYAKRPVLIGYSDITALHAYLYSRLGISGIHGPNLLDLIYLEKTSLEKLITFLNSDTGEILLEGISYREGQAEGIVLGGNLVTFSSLCGTPYLIFPKNVILVLEEINEKPHKIERALLQLVFSFRDRIKGMVLGNMGLERERERELLEAMGSLLPEDIPIGYGFPIGHIPHSQFFLIGKKGRLEVTKERATLVQDT